MLEDIFKYKKAYCSKSKSYLLITTKGNALLAEKKKVNKAQN